MYSKCIVSCSRSRLGLVSCSRSHLGLGCIDRIKIKFFFDGKEDKNKRGGDVSIKEKREKEKESQEKRKEKITKKRLKRNSGIEGSSSSELKS